MTNATQSIEKKTAPVTLGAFLNSPGAKGRLAEVASKFMRPDDLIRLTLMAASRQPEILKCSHHSILRALMDAASMGIAPGGTMGRGYLVPRKNKKTGELEACFDPGWRGLSDIAKRSGLVKRIDAKVVYETDIFEYEEGTEQRLRHVPNLDLVSAEDDGRGRIIAAYAIATFEGGDRQIEVLTKSDIERIKAVSMAQNGPWSSWYDEMARKSAVRRLCKYLPYDPILEKALEHATDAETGMRTVLDTTAIEATPRAKSLAASIRTKVQDDEDPAADPQPDAGATPDVDGGSDNPDEGP